MDLSGARPMLAAMTRPALLLLPFLAFACPSIRATEPPPNFILILADDLGYGDLGCYGSTTIATPQ